IPMKLSGVRAADASQQRRHRDQRKYSGNQECTCGHLSPPVQWLIFVGISSVVRVRRRSLHYQTLHGLIGIAKGRAEVDRARLDILSELPHSARVEDHL